MIHSRRSFRRLLQITAALGLLLLTPGCAWFQQASMETGAWLGLYPPPPEEREAEEKR